MPRVRKVQSKRSVPATWRDALDQYLLFKRAQGLRPVTLRGHNDVIKLFFKRHPEGYDAPDPRNAVYAFMGESIKPATYNIRRNYLKQFFAWGLKEGIFSHNPLDSLRKRKDEGRVVELSPETLTRLLAAPSVTSYAGLRDYALLLLTLDTGIRPKEACYLELADINLSSREVYVRSEVAKTKISRTLPISPVTASTIDKLIRARHPQWSDAVPVFCTADGTRLSRDSWGDRLNIYGRKLGVKVRPYDLRHAFALQYLRNGGNALALQRTMGHADLSMTKRYVAITQGDLREQHALASPLNTLLPQRSRVRKLTGK